VAEREKHMEELQAAVDAFPARLEDEAARVVTSTTERLQAEFTSREALLKKEFEGERNVLQGRIEALENLTRNQEKHIATLTSQQEKAYEKVQEIASKAVSSAGERFAGWAAPERPPRASGEDRG
jgi:phage-related minor tail protein